MEISTVDDEAILTAAFQLDGIKVKILVAEVNDLVAEGRRSADIAFLKLALEVGREASSSNSNWLST